MEWLSNILTSGNGIPTMIFALIIVGVIVLGIKKGWFSFSGKGLKIGNDDLERTIIRTQIEWAEADTMNMLRSLTEVPDMDIFKAKYTIERVLDELVKIIVLNHITLEPTYIKLKQDKVWSVVSTINPEPKWDNLESLVKERVENAIKSLYNIRKYYKDNNK